MTNRPFRLATHADVEPDWRLPVGEPDVALSCTHRYRDGDDDDAFCGARPATAVVEDGEDDWRGGARCAGHLMDDKDRVIARLLDGWRPCVDQFDGDKAPDWFHEEADLLYPMSDGEAAIIRNHQEKS